MDLKEYFAANRGTAVFSTAGADGQVGTAIFSRPHFQDDGSISFIMLERLNYKNLQENPKAAYLFVENGQGYSGLRLHLKKIGEDDDREMIARMSGRDFTPEDEAAKGSRHIVYFTVEKVLPLVGSGEPPVTS